jgi:hypothetical protein
MGAGGWRRIRLMEQLPRSGVCVILCPPWPRSGSSSLFMAQVRAYLAMGYDVVVVAVPQDSTHLADAHDFWSQVASDFQFDPRQPVFLNRCTRPMRPFVSGVYWSWLARKRDSVIAIEARFASGSAFEPGFTALVDERGVDVIHVNHCVNMGLAHRIADRSRRRLAAAPTILLDTHDVQAERYQSSEIVNPFTGRRDATASLERDELALSRGATALLHLTTRDFPNATSCCGRPRATNRMRSVAIDCTPSSTSSMSGTATGRTPAASNGSSTRLRRTWI